MKSVQFGAIIFLFEVKRYSLKLFIPMEVGLGIGFLGLDEVDFNILVKLWDFMVFKAAGGLN
jgi:hypothetical protein